MKRLLLLTSALVAVSTGARAQIVFQGQSTFDSNYPAAFSGSRGNPAGFTVGGGAADANASLSLSARGTGQVIVPSPLNVTSSQGYLIGGLQAIDLSVGALGQWGVYVGPGAGSYQLYNGVAAGYGSVGIGTYALNALQNSGGENTCGGAFACQYATTFYGATAWGEHTIGYDNANYVTAIGNDVMRDTVGNANSTAVGATSQDDGVGSSNTSLGSFALQGNAGSITIGGTITTGDVLTFPISSTNPNVAGLPTSVSYTVTAGDTNTTILAGNIAPLLGAANIWTPGGGPSPGNGVRFAAGNNAAPGGGNSNVIKYHFPGGQSTGWAITIGPMTCVGTCGETATFQTAYSGTDNIAIGSWTMYGGGLGGGSYNTAIGDYSGGYLRGAASSNVLVGHSSGAAMTTDSNETFIGAYSGYHAAGSSQGYNVCVGWQSCFGMTNGNENTLIGASQNQNDMVSGTGNIQLGYGANSISNSGNWQINIGNVLFASGTNVGAGGSSYGWSGIQTKAGNATFTIGDGAGQATTYGSHFGVLQTTKPTITNGTVDTTASDTAGTVTLTAANPVVTFKVAYQTAPHCVISSPSGTAFTYSVSTTALTLTGGANTNTVTYHCIQ